MRTSVPTALVMPFTGVEGAYCIDLQPNDGWKDRIDVVTDDTGMRWDVVYAERGDEGLVLGGMTLGSEAIWGDQFWFEFSHDDDPPSIRYWGDRVISREDRSESSKRRIGAGDVSI